MKYIHYFACVEMSCEYFTTYILTKLPFTKLVQQRENNYIYFTYLLNLNFLEMANSIFVKQ